MTDSLNLLKSPAFYQDPYPVYWQFRAQGQPVWLPQPNQHITTQGTWLFFNHDDISRLIQDTQRVSHEIAHHRTAGSANFYDLNMLLRDADDHQRLRKLVSEFFSAQFLQNLSATILDLVHETLDGLTGQDSFNLVADFAAVLPPRIMARILGMPEDDAEQIRAWTLALHDMSDGLLGDVSANQRHVLTDLYRYVSDKYLDDAGPPSKQTVIEKLRRDEQAGTISRDEALAMLALLVAAGNATVTALLSTTMWLLLSHPAQMARLRANPNLLDSAIEESLRFESPVQRTIFRITTDTVDLGRFRLEKGQQLSLVVGSANRDQAAFSEADVFNIARTSKAHLAFGRGVHTCLGKHLAYMESRIILRALLERLPNIQLVTTHPVWRHNSMFRELQELWVRTG